MVQPGAVIPNSIPMEALGLTMVPWRVCWLVVADSHHFDEEPDPHPRQIGKSDP